MPLPGFRKIGTAVVCYTQAAFDALPQDEDAEPLGVTLAREVATTAAALVAALRAAGVETEEVRVPLRGFSARDYSRAALQWRLLTLTQSNDRTIDAAICLDFPAWAVAHPHKICWVRDMPVFISLRRVSFAPPPRPRRAAPDTNTVFNADPEEPSVVASLSQAEQRGLTEAAQVFAAARDIAESIARSGIKVEYLPMPAADLPPDAPAWAAVAAKLAR